eukprot:3425811-Alexandrium_andersonii.AAC.1
MALEEIIIAPPKEDDGGTNIAPCNDDNENTNSARRNSMEETKICTAQGRQQKKPTLHRTM